MPWKATCPMDERLSFIAEWQKGERTMTELCERFGISRKTGYKWKDRYLTAGIDGLKDRSRAPRHHPNAISLEMEQRLLTEKHRHPRWGPRKVISWLAAQSPETRFPAPSTVGELFKRHGLVRSRSRRRRSPPYTRPFEACGHPNAVWCADFKGQFLTGPTWCYPLTISDAYSRYFLCCQGLTRPNYEQTQPHFEAVFRDYGVPLAIRTDNGPPFASVGLGGLSRLSVWWVKLGIFPERIEPGHPEQNGRHERLHRTLKEETARPPADTLLDQQQKMDAFRQEYNDQRPHEALGMQAPSQFYQPSPRPYPARLPAIVYPTSYQVRRVKQSGEFKWHQRLIWASQVLVGEPLGFHQIAEDRWQVYFGPLLVGILDERKGKIERPVPGARAWNGS